MSENHRSCLLALGSTLILLAGCMAHEGSELEASPQVCGSLPEAAGGETVSGAVSLAHGGFPDSARGFPTPPSEIAYSGTGIFGMSLVKGDHRVDLSAHEKSPDDGIYYNWTVYRTTDYDVRALCGRHANEFYVYGLALDGSPVLERWDLEPWPSGAYYTERKVAGTPLGTPVRASQTFMRYEKPFVKPALRTPPIVTRSPLPSPAISGEVVEIEADPEGRFLMLRSVDAQGGSTLTRFVPSSGALVVVADPTTHPQMASANNFVFLDSTERGRLIRVGFDESLRLLYLVDAQNDGDFESSFVLMNGMENSQALPGFTTTLYP